jgi:hypothetical protein
MDKDEALRLALEALEKTQSALARCMGPHKSEEGDRHRALAHSRTTITAIKASLEAKDEPVAWKETDELECPICKVKAYPYPKCGHVKYVDEQEAFENWHSRRCPSGDAESVQHQWGSSSDYADLYTTPPEAQPAPVQEPVAWMHVMDNTEGLKANGKGIVLITQKRKHPFGKPGVDFSKSYPVISTPLYTTPPAAQRQWVGLTTEDILNLGAGIVNFEYAKAIEAKLKEKNNG